MGMTHFTFFNGSTTFPNKHCLFSATQNECPSLQVNKKSGSFHKEYDL